jgi:hypothetical protein
MDVLYPTNPSLKPTNIECSAKTDVIYPQIKPLRPTKRPTRRCQAALSLFGSENGRPLSHKSRPKSLQNAQLSRLRPP